ncbi:MAG: hypothetical protein OHK0056_32550 [Bacteriovoracaceae bacterium]
MAVVSGELIEVYEDRWFYEASSMNTPRFLLLFELINGAPKFHFIETTKIRGSSSIELTSSLYRDYLKSRNIRLENSLVESAHVLTGNEGHHKFEKMFGNFAWDIGVIDEHGRTHSGDGYLLSDYFIFDREVRSPVRGKVVGRVSDQIDNPPNPKLTGNLSGKINNYLTIHIEGPFYFSIVHFKQNSVYVDLGDEIQVGDVLGLVGNSGVSYVPHLHYTLYAYISEYDRFISVPIPKGARSFPGLVKP